MAPRRAAIAAWLVVLGLCAVVIVNTRFVSDLSAFLPESPAPEQRFLVDQLRSGAVARLMLLGIEGADGNVRATLSRELTGRLRSDPLFATASNGMASGFEREREILFAYRYALSPNISPQRFETAGLRDAISETVDLLATSAGLLVKPLVVRDPTGETLALANDLQRGDGPPLESGVWSAGGRALIVVLTRAGAADLDAQASAAARVEALFAEIVAKTGPSATGAGLVMSGAGVFSARSRALIERDVVRLTTASAVLVATLLLLVYRSGIALGLGLVPVVTGAIAGVAAVSLGFGVVHGITLGFGTTLIGEAVDYAIYLFVQAEGAGQADREEWLARFWPTVRLGVFTSIAGFCALLFSGLPGLAQLGLYSIVGLAAAAAVTRFVLPWLLPGGFRIRDVSQLGARLEAATRWLSRAHWAVVILAVSAVVVLAARSGDLWDTELASLNPITARDRAIDAELRAGLAAADARNVIAVTGKDLEQTLEEAERIGERLDRLVETGKIGGYDSPSRILPSIAMQQRRLASLPDAETLRPRLRAALVDLPLRAEKLEPFLEDVARARTMRPLTRKDIEGTALEAALDGMLHATPDSRWTAILRLRPARAPAGIDAGAVKAAIASAGIASAVFVDLKAEVDGLYAGYFRRALAASAAGLVVIVILLLATLRDARRVARVLAPLVAGVLVVAAAHALAGTRLTLLHLVGLLLVVAIGSNYALFFERVPPRGDPASRRALASLALANATTVGSFAILSLSSIPVLHAIGSTVALGAFLTLAFTAALSNRHHSVAKHR